MLSLLMSATGFVRSTSFRHPLLILSLTKSVEQSIMYCDLISVISDKRNVSPRSTGDRYHLVERKSRSKETWRNDEWKSLRLDEAQGNASRPDEIAALITCDWLRLNQKPYDSRQLFNEIWNIWNKYKV